MEGGWEGWCWGEAGGEGEVGGNNTRASLGPAGEPSTSSSSSPPSPSPTSTSSRLPSTRTDDCAGEGKSRDDPRDRSGEISAMGEASLELAPPLASLPPDPPLGPEPPPPRTCSSISPTPKGVEMPVWGVWVGVGGGGGEGVQNNSGDSGGSTSRGPVSPPLSMLPSLSPSPPSAPTPSLPPPATH